MNRSLALRQVGPQPLKVGGAHGLQVFSAGEFGMQTMDAQELFKLANRVAHGIRTPVADLLFFGGGSGRATASRTASFEAEFMVKATIQHRARYIATLPAEAFTFPLLARPRYFECYFAPGLVGHQVQG